MKNPRFLLYLMAAILVLSATALSSVNSKFHLRPTWNPKTVFSIEEDLDHQAGTTITIKDEAGNIISKTSRTAPGDQIIQPDGKHYKVIKTDNNSATARLMGSDKEYLAYRDLFNDISIPAASTNQNRQTVGIYHTHSAESYVPTDGTESIPFSGGIYQVGKSLVNKLQNSNVRVSYDETPHDPHDNNAYYRSRRTAVNIVKQNPVAILDIHRDGIPDANYYRESVSDTNVAQLRLVVGRQNPNMQANLDFAKKMMAYANKTHPGIVKEIFMAKGNYNQDLMPTALLIEAGTHLNSKEEAQRGITLFADAIPTALNITAGPQGITEPGSKGAWSALAWIIGLTVIGGGVFLVISSGGFKQAGSRLSSFVSREFTGFLGPVNNIRKKFTSKKKD